ncbi:cupin domain-containing protein [Nocardioides pantholopis]|uniref:cupin domain-containing protein n=1 Tax=Nocardioides pantholopis TaxID=2483798 RepID=UPI000F091FF9|nr:cupin domain-containing protein [Nocardioides pantholopis]
MTATSLTALAESQLTAAREASAGRAAVTVYGGQEHDLRQTLIALADGRALGEHESPGEATLQVLRGRVRLQAGEDAWEAAAGELLVVPDARHDLAALEDAVVLLTVATSAIPAH